MYYDNDSLDKTTDHQDSPVNKEYQVLQGNINTLTFNLDDPWLSLHVSLMYNRWVIANQVNKEYQVLKGNIKVKGQNNNEQQK
jgi:hypothetical protein